MPTARLLGKGKSQKLVIDEITEPGSIEVTRDENEELKLEVKPKGKKDNGKETENSGGEKKSDRKGFFDEYKPVIDAE